jgi:lipopolysaccharide transport system ATP-binding protein
MPAPAIEVENLGKRYFLGENTSHRRLAHAIVPWLRQRNTREFWALRNVSFTVEQGETVGIIGRNGAGKSTLLKVLSRITAPSEGRARVRGRVGTLLEVGTGFHPELTGRDNIFLSGTILGLSYREVGRRFDEIVAFAEVEEFIDTPVKRYSSGMYVRLAFAVAMFLDPDILIVDEVLAVGDLGFQRKSVGRLEDASRKEGRTVLFVSHTMPAIRKFCRRVVVFDHGRVTFDGATGDGIEHYTKSIAESFDLTTVGLSDRLQRTSGAARFTKLEALDAGGENRWSFRTGETVVFRLEFETFRAIKQLGIIFQLSAVKDEIANLPEFVVTRLREAISHKQIHAGHRGTLEIVFRHLKLRPGEFRLYVLLGDIDGEMFCDVIDENVGLPHLTIKSDALNGHEKLGVVSLDYEFRIRAGDHLTGAVERIDSV